MDGKKAAVVVSHPAHLLAVAGMQLRWKPQVLVINSAADARLDKAIRTAFGPLRMAERLTSLEISEAESYTRVLTGDFAFHAHIGDRIFEWLRAARPDAVIGNAYEASHFHHDIARLLIDDSVQRLRVLGRRVENYEFPLSCRIDAPGTPVQYGTFPFGAFQTLQLNPRELVAKRELAATVSRDDAGVAGVAPLFANPEVEPFREVSPDRDYTAPPPGLALLYDERGREAVRAGRYAEAVTFRNHFVPLVYALGLGPAARAAA